MGVGSEAALGKTNWTDDQYDSGIPNPISGRDKLEVRKVDASGAIVGGPYTGAGVYSAGEEGILYIPGDGKKFNFYSNPNSNWYNQNETYAHNILSGFAFKNFRYESGQAKTDININHYSIDENTTLTAGKWYITNSVTINSGVTLTIPSGTELYFNNGASLIINGTLNAVGSSSNNITFTRNGSSGTWGGIQFNSGSSGSLQYCTIQYASYGIYCYNSSPSIAYCRLENNQDAGVNLYYYSSSSLYYNTILNNYSGVVCGDHSSPNMMYPGHNVIRNNNATGVAASYYSNPQIGSSSGYGNNSIYNNSASISANIYCTIDAQNNYWGGGNPVIYTSGNSVVNYLPILTTDPNPGRAVVVPTDKQGIAETISLSVQGGDDDLANALDKEKNKKYGEAIPLFLKVFKNNKDGQLGSYALCKIEECFTQGNRKDYQTYSNSEIKPLIKEGSENYALALDLETHQFINAGLYKSAISNLLLILQKNNVNEAIERNTLFTLGTFYHLFNGDEVNSDTYFEELKRKYPDDELVSQIEIIKRFGVVSNNLAQNSELMPAEEMVKPGEGNGSVIISNYPNPFNPTTKISFSLPQRSQIKLKVFDVLGREIQILADDIYEAGKYEVEFNATNLPSGVYFYNLTTGSNSITKKMLLMK